MMKRVYTHWCQGTTSALMSKATMWKIRQRYVPKLVYSVCVNSTEYFGKAKRSLLYGWHFYFEIHP